MAAAHAALGYPGGHPWQASTWHWPRRPAPQPRSASRRATA